MIYAYDIISDLNLTEESVFNWEDKPTSLYCMVAGNVSSDIHVLYKTIKHLSTLYQGVFFIDGFLENTVIAEKDLVIQEITKIFSTIKNAVYLHNNVVIMDGIAIVGVNGWFGNKATDADSELQLKINRYDDLAYLQKTVEKLQLHIDVKQIVVISNSVPSTDLYFGEKSDFTNTDVPLSYVIESDTEQKIHTWIFGSHKKIVDTKINSINYFNNPCYDSNPYYPKRINILD